ncbi:YacL family protein [Thalassotalea eurytherma]|uniref:UPF0231 protein n=1 Tax=Thalassotalea eurytherma TaxID=1144278 RepID=A0ABQ6H739_9GAMM|nr:YacL family protein [Thalassotalea eurytherma]GLX83319.1 UPF0231 protein [Thalassotalea eurytherma]
MEYQFSHDTTSGNLRARFNLEHQVFGQWLETEVGRDATQLAKINKLIDGINQAKQHELRMTGHQYTLVLSEHDAMIALNASIEGEELEESLSEQALDFDENESASCGLDDFQSLMHAWANFITN